MKRLEKKVEETVPEEEPIEVGQVWWTTAGSWVHQFAVEITEVLDERVHIRPLGPEAGINDYTIRDFRSLYSRLPFHREASS
jgi:hypothetical protein